MLIVFDEPENFPDHDVLALNVDIWESFIISEEGGHFPFQLSVYRQLDSEEMTAFYGIRRFKTYEDCAKLFAAIVVAIQEGDKVFYMKEYLDRFSSSDEQGESPLKPTLDNAYL